MAGTRWKIRLAKSFGFVAISVIGLGLASSARADWEEDFDAGFAQSWTFAATDDNGDPPLTGVSAFEIVEAGADDYLRISHSTIAFKDRGGGATDGFGYVSEVFGDVAIFAEVNASPLDGQQNLLGVLGRANPLTGTGYVAGVDFANSFFAIGRIDDFLFPLVVDTTVLIDPSESYRIQFFLLGPNLIARLIEGSTGEVLSTITTVDVAYSSGGAGILVETEYDSNDFPVAPIIGTFDNVRAVPEPSLAALIGWGGVGLAGLVRLRRTTADSRSSSH